MRTGVTKRIAGLTLIAITGVLADASHAGVITSGNIVPVPVGTVGSGNGTLDFILFTESSGGRRPTTPGSRIFAAPQ